MTASERIAHPSRKEFLTLAREHTLVPVYRTLTADLETPVSAFLRAAWSEPECFLLESVEGGEQVGRYTFIGLAPYKRIVARGRKIAITEGSKTTHLEGDVFAVLRDALGGHKPARLPGCRRLPPARWAFSPMMQCARSSACPQLAKDELGVPDACLLFFDEVLAFDHVRKQIWLVVTADVTLDPPAEAYDQRRHAGWTGWRSGSRGRCPKSARPKTAGKLKVKHRTRKKDYLAAVERTKRIHCAPATFSRPCSRSASMWSPAWTASRCTAPCAP